MRRVSWPDVPIIISGAVLFVGGVLLMVNLVMGALWHGKQMKLDAAVFGVTRPPQVAFSVPNLLSGQFQKAAALRVGGSEPYFATAVRLRNQLEYSIFDVSATPSVVVGKQYELFETVYIDDYCSRNVAGFMRRAPAWAGMIRRMQDEVQRRGQVFLYVVTPSKVAQYPGYLPDKLPCPSSQADRTQVVPDWMALVRQAGVRAVDTTAVLTAAKRNYAFDLFPRGGTHWNAAGAALGAQAIEAGLAAQLPYGPFAPFRFTWVMSPHPEKSDVDLTFLMNLFWPPVNFEVPRVTMVQAPRAKNCRKVNIVIVGGSFMEHIGPALSLLPCGAHVVEYFYWSLHRSLFMDGGFTIGPVDLAERDAELRRADVIIYEENEALLAHASQGPALYDWLFGQPWGY